MTEPIKLPPVPPIPVELCYWSDGESIAIKLLQIYGEQCAKAAIEADRNERGGCENHISRQARLCECQRKTAAIIETEREL